MSHVTRPRVYGPPTPEVAAAKTEHDRMARNRSGVAPQLGLLPVTKPMDGDAFRVTRLCEAETRAGANVQQCREAFNAAKGKPARDKARKALQTAQRGLRACEKALAAEKLGEEAAPAAQRLPTAQGKVMLREARAVVLRGRAEVVTALGRLRARRSITEAQCAAGRLYRHAWETAHMDMMPVSIGEGMPGSAPTSGNRRVEEAVGSGIALARLRARLTPASVNLIEHVIVHDLTVESWAARQMTPRGNSMSKEHAMGMMLLALDLLKE